MTPQAPSHDAEPTEIRELRRHHLALAIVLGTSIGVLAVAFQSAVTWISALQDIILSSDLSPTTSTLVILGMCVTGGGIAGLLAQRIAPEAGGSGIPHVKAALAHSTSIRGLRIIFVKFIGGILVIGNRFSLGREGPTVHLGAALADEIGKISKAPQHLRDHLIACGAGAGLAAAFNAPLAGFLFVIEELRREVNSITLGMALLGTVLADSIVQLSRGNGPSLIAPGLEAPTMASIPIIICIALAATGAGLLFNRILISGVRRTSATIPAWIRGASVGALVWCCVMYLPSATDDVQSVFSAFLGNSLHSTSVQALCALFVVKLVLTVACYVTGVPGGIFAPMLVQGIFVGLVVGNLAALTPFAVPTPTVCAMLGMTAFFAASVRAPFTGVVLLAEMTNGFQLLLPLMAVALIAYLLSELIGSKPIYERLMEVSRDKRS